MVGGPDVQTKKKETKPHGYLTESTNLGWLLAPHCLHES